MHCLELSRKSIKDALRFSRWQRNSARLDLAPVFLETTLDIRDRAQGSDCLRIDVVVAFRVLQD
jgi:hypothetical protein